MRVAGCFRSALLLGVCAVLAAGCGLTRRGGTPDLVEDDLLTPGELDQLDGDHALGGRFGEGSRVSDVMFERVHFGYDSFQVADSEVPKIQQVAEYLRRNPSARLVVEGHCDERGSRVYNMSLGEHRALAVRAYLIMLGIDSSRIQTRSYGEEMPLDPGHTPAAYELNRRSEFVVMQQ